MESFYDRAGLVDYLHTIKYPNSAHKNARQARFPGKRPAGLAFSPEDDG